MRRAKALLVALVPPPSTSGGAKETIHLSNSRVPQEGQHRLRGSLVLEHLSEGGDARMLSAKRPTYPLPHPPRLRGPGSTPSNKMELGLSLTAPTPLALVARNPANLAA